MDHQVFDEICKIIPADAEFYVAGGYVRDRLMGVEAVDFDFVLGDNVNEITRKIANRLGGAFLALDEKREIARVVFSHGDQRLYFDFARMRGASIEEDLRNRDVTINAMAFDPRRPDVLIDPCNGKGDLRNKIIRMCNDDSFEQDPARLLRTVRLATGLNFRLESHTIGKLRSSAPLITRVSGERNRDEIFKILESGSCARGIRLLDHLGLLSFVFPELSPLKSHNQGSPHVFDIWEHTLQLIQTLDELFSLIYIKGEKDQAQNFLWGNLLLQIGRFLPELSEHFRQKPTIPRTKSGLLAFAGLYHDVGKPDCVLQVESEKVKFPGHEEAGAKKIGKRAKDLALSNLEIDRLTQLVRNHSLLNKMNDQSELPDDREIYRFYRKTGDAGLDLCFLFLADGVATYGKPVPQDVWIKKTGLCARLISYWFEKKEIVDPPRLITGDDIITELNLPPGPLIGRLLEEVTENQAAGEIIDRSQALMYIQNKIRFERESHEKKHS